MSRARTHEAEVRGPCGRVRVPNCPILLAVTVSGDLDA